MNIGGAEMTSTVLPRNERSSVEVVAADDARVTRRNRKDHRASLRRARGDDCHRGAAPRAEPGRGASEDLGRRCRIPPMSSSGRGRTQEVRDHLLHRATSSLESWTRLVPVSKRSTRSEGRRDHRFTAVTPTICASPRGGWSRFPTSSILRRQGIASRVLARTAGGNLTLFAFDAGQELTEHTSLFDALVMVLEGSLAVTIDGKELTATPGTIVRMPSSVPHAVRAPERARMLLLMLRDAAGADR